MYYKRKAYDELLRWKQSYADRYAVLLEGARRVGKSTIAEQFAKNEYDSYLLIDFAKATKALRDCFDDIGDLDMFFLRLQAVTGVNLKKGRSVLIFDEVQLFPKARQAIKYLVADGRYHYIETGSLISIKKNIQNILIPSEEMKINVYPMDYEEFLLATANGSYELLRQAYRLGKPMGQDVNRKLMRDFRIYMAVGGMPQAVRAYAEGRSFSEIDRVKREIIRLYENDFKKIDDTGKIAMFYHSIPAQLSRNAKRYQVARATGKRKQNRDESLIYDMVDSKTVLISYNTTDPFVSLSLTKDMGSYKLYLADTGLFVTLMFMDRPAAENELYAKLLSDRLPANLGYLYENAVAQMIQAADRELYYHTWKKEGSTHYYEVDFLISNGAKVVPIEVKSSGTGKHESLAVFARKYAKCTTDAYILSQKDISDVAGLKNLPIYMTPFLVE